MVWDVLDAAAADPFGFRQWNADDPEGEDVEDGSPAAEPELDSKGYHETDHVRRYYGTTRL